MCLSKPFFLKNAIESNFFDSENYYWIDAGLFHHGIFPETHGGIEKFTRVNNKNYWPVLEKSVCNPTMIERLESKNKSGYIFIGQDGYSVPTPWYHNFCDINKMTHIVGGLFGGTVIERFTKRTNDGKTNGSEENSSGDLQ